LPLFSTLTSAEPFAFLERGDFRAAKPPDSFGSAVEIALAWPLASSVFVHQDSLPLDAYAVYYAAFSDKHEPRLARVIVSLGSWGGSDPDEVPSDRVAFAMDIRSGPDTYDVMVTNASESLWADARLLGRKLEREEALAHPWISEAFHVTDHMVTEDPPLRAFLDRELRPN
jgi:hypothetical protein